MQPVSAPRRSTNCTSAGSSSAGSVSGRAQSVVMPPAAAACAAEAMVSRCSAPGSPSAARKSTRPGREAERRGVHHLRALGTAEAGAVVQDCAVLEQQVARRVRPGRRVEQPRAGDERGRHRLKRSAAGRGASTSSTAMRTATPISTCSPITLRSGSSATALSISTPRFIGPGCMTMASGFATASFSASSP